MHFLYQNISKIKQNISNTFNLIKYYVILYNKQVENIENLQSSAESGFNPQIVYIIVNEIIRNISMLQEQ